MPTLLAGALVAFLQALNQFGAPAILGLPAGIHTITTQIWAFFQYPPRLDLAAFQHANTVKLIFPAHIFIANGLNPHNFGLPSGSRNAVHKGQLSDKNLRAQIQKLN